MAKPYYSNQEYEDTDQGSGTGPSGSSTTAPSQTSSTPPAGMPTVTAGTALAVTTTTTAITLTSDQIKAAGGPWANFMLRVTPINAAGSGTPAELGATKTMTGPDGTMLSGPDGTKLTNS